LKCVLFNVLNIETKGMEILKKIILVAFFLSALTGCKSYLFNKGLEKMGVFDSKIHLTEIKNEAKEVIFFPMKHIANEEFYNDTKYKIDSLKKLGYYFFYESINVLIDDTITLRKFRKLKGMPISKPSLGYMYLIDSVYKFKLKKKIIDQPKYNTLGIDSFSGKRVDLNLRDIITAYESRYGEIKLEPCDFETSVYKKSACNDKKIDNKVIYNLLLTLRNQKIVNEILLHKGIKIALVYGEEHFIEIKAALLSNGFTLSN
jgi:hypothetical protein